MRIDSNDGKSWIAIERWSDAENAYSAYAVEASVNGNHSVFRGRNGDVQLLALPTFIETLDDFVTNRETSPRLEGTDDSYIRFHGTATRVAVDFRIGDVHCGPETRAFSVEGSFDIDQAQVLRIIADFRSLGTESDKSSHGPGGDAGR